MQKLRCLAVIAALCAPLLGAEAPQDPWPPPGALTIPSPGIVPPALVERSNPTYTRDAMFAKIQGVVALSCVIEPDGSVGAVKVVRSLGSGLDEQAIAAAKRWRFKPATKDGVAVRVVVPITIGFWLKGEPPPSTWPAIFPGATDAPANDADWDEAKAGAAGVTMRVPHPKTWTIQDPNVDVFRIVSPNGRHFVNVSEPRPLPGPLPLPFPIAQLPQVNASFSKMIGGHDFSSIDGGQVRTGDRWWLWQDQLMPTTAALRLPPEVRDAMSAEFDSLRLWLFITDVDSKVVMVFCWALVPRGLAPADLERELRPATAVFDRMIKRMVLQKSASSS
jgi:TonB family protein